MTAYAKTIYNGIDMDALTQTIEMIQNNPELGQCQFRIENKWISGGHNHTCVQGFHSLGQENDHACSFELDADEPAALGGTDHGANPVEHLLNALAGCVTTSMVAHAAARGIPVEEVESHVEGDIDLRGFLGLDPKVPKGYQNIRITFQVKVAPEYLPRLKELAEFSPVYNTLTHSTHVDIQIEPK